jgi:hypothetical protein
MVISKKLQQSKLKKLLLKKCNIYYMNSFIKYNYFWLCWYLFTPIIEQVTVGRKKKFELFFSSLLIWFLFSATFNSFLRHKANKQTNNKNWTISTYIFFFFFVVFFLLLCIYNHFKKCLFIGISITQLL